MTKKAIFAMFVPGDVWHAVRTSPTPDRDCDELRTVIKAMPGAYNGKGGIKWRQPDAWLARPV